MGPISTKFRASLCSLIFIAFAQSVFAQSSEQVSFEVGPIPTWVKNVEADYSAKPASSKGLSEFYFLVDKQVDVPTGATYWHVVKSVAGENGLKDLPELDFNFDPSFERLSLHKIQIRRGTNTIDCLDRKKIKIIQQEKDLQRHIYDGRVSAVLFLEDVRVGDFVEYAYTRRGRNPIFGSKFMGSFEVQWRVPVLHQYYRLVTDANRSLLIKNHSTDVKAVIARDGERQEYLWVSTNVPAVVPDDRLPDWFQPYPWIQITEFKDWAEVAQWASELYPMTNAASASLTRKIEEIRQRPQGEGQILAALQFVQDDVRYLGVEVGPSSHRPNIPATVLERRFGDCKDKAFLFCFILRQLGIAAHPVLVNSEETKAVNGFAPSPLAFNHVIATFELNGLRYWVDPTRGYQRGLLSQRYLPDYGYGMIVSPETKSLSPIPYLVTGKPKTEIKEVYTFRTTNGPIELHVKTAGEGLDAESLRSQLADFSQEELDKNYLNFYAENFPDIQLLKPAEVHDYAESNRIEIFESYLISNVWTKAEAEDQQTVSFYPEQLRDVVQLPKINTKRSMPLRIRHPVDYHQTIEVVLPEPWEIKNEHTTINTKQFSFSSKIDYRRNKLTLDYRFKSLTNVVAAAEVSEYSKKIDNVVHKLGYEIYKDVNQGDPKIAKATGLNWGVLVAVAFFGALMTIGAVFAYRYQPVTAPVAEQHFSPLNGIRGWLTLVAIGVVLRPFLLLNVIRTNWSAYSSETWNILTVPGAASYHPLWAPALLFELFGNVGFTVLSVLVCVLFFQKRRTFPIWFSISLCSYFAFLIVDQILCSQIPEAAKQSDSDLSRQLFRAGFGAVVWSSYMVKSKRVKSTFVR